MCLKRVGFPTPVPLRRAWNKELMEFRCSSVAAEGPWTSLLPAQVPQGSAVDSLLIDFTHCRSIEDVVRRFEEARDAMMKVQRCGHVLVVCSRVSLLSLTVVIGGFMQHVPSMAR